MSDVCSTCRYCQPGTPWKGYCAKWGIAVEYSGSCLMHREASPHRKGEIAKAQSWLKDHGFVEVKK